MGRDQPQGYNTNGRGSFKAAAVPTGWDEGSGQPIPVNKRTNYSGSMMLSTLSFWYIVQYWIMLCCIAYCTIFVYCAG